MVKLAQVLHPACLANHTSSPSTSGGNVGVTTCRLWAATAAARDCAGG